MTFKLLYIYFYGIKFYQLSFKYICEKVDTCIKCRAHGVFLELPSTGALNIEILESQLILKWFAAIKPFNEKLYIQCTFKYII